jgi:hypothetical protein
MSPAADQLRDDLRAVYGVSDDRTVVEWCEDERSEEHTSELQSREL